MDGNNDQDRDRVQFEVDYGAVEGDGERGRYSVLMRCASQSSLDESSQRPGAGGGVGGGGGAGGVAGGGEAAAGGHATRLLSALSRLRADRTLCDVVLMAQAECVLEGGAPEADGGGARGGAPEGGAAAAAAAEVAAHRAVLSAASPYFLAMFTQFTERTRPTVTIQNIEPHALEAIIEYIYNPESLVITEDNVQALLAGASLVQVWGVRSACGSFLAGALCADNALGIRAFADLHACADLAAAAQRFIDLHFSEVIESEEFLVLDSDVLCQLLDSDRITVPNEEVILDAVIRWMQHDPEKRSGSLGAVLEHVRLPLVAQEALVARATAPPLAAADLRVKDLLIEALAYHLLPCRRPAPGAGSGAAGAARRTVARAGAGGVAALLVAGGQAPKAVRGAELLPLGAAPAPAPGGGAWRPVAALPGRRCRAGLARVRRGVFAVGGFNGSLRVRSVDVYQPRRDLWAPGPPLHARRSTLGVAALGEVIYAVGGFDGVTGLSSAEALDTAAERPAWRPVAAMAARRSSVGVAALHGRLYAVGGYDGAARQCLHTVERYDPATDAWSAAPSMSVRRSGAGVGAVGGALYAVGGHDGPSVRRSVERLVLGEGGGDGGDGDHTPPPRWEAAPPMHTPRRNAAVVAHRGRLYVVGGDDGTTNLDTVEVFDPATETWSVLPERMSVGRSYAGVAVLEWPA